MQVVTDKKLSDHVPFSPLVYEQYALVFSEDKFKSSKTYRPFNLGRNPAVISSSDLISLLVCLRQIKELITDACHLVHLSNTH